MKRKKLVILFLSCMLLTGCGRASREEWQDEEKDSKMVTQDSSVLSEEELANWEDMFSHMEYADIIDEPFSSEDGIDWEKIYANRKTKHYSPKKYKCVSGRKLGDQYRIRVEEAMPEDESYYHPVRNPARMVTFRKNIKKNRIDFVSNEFLWEENSRECFDIQINECKSNTKLIAFDPDYDKGWNAIIVHDGKKRASLSHCNFTRIDDVWVLDVNRDGYEDVILAGDTVDGKKLGIYKATEWDSEYTTGIMLEDEELAQAAMVELGDDLTLDRIEKFLFPGAKDGVYETYQDAYIDILNMYQRPEGHETMTYDLYYVDEDDIPELLVGDSGYWLTLYSFKDGKTYKVIDDWGYGAGGNYGYEYAPYKNCIRNYNTDYAGAIMKIYYCGITENNKVETLYSERDYQFEDKNNNDAPDEDECTDAYITYTTKYQNNTDELLTDEEIRQKMDDFDGYSYEFMSGKLSYQEVLEKLSK